MVLEIITGAVGVATLIYFSFNIGVLVLYHERNNWTYFKSYLSIAVGMIFYSYAFTILGVLGILSPASMFVFIFITQAFALYRLKSPLFWIKYVRNRIIINRTIWLFVFFTILYLFNPFVLSFFNPIIGYDALAYHIYIPWYSIFESHNLKTNALIPNSGLPLGAQGIFAWLIPFFGYKYINFINLFYIIASLHIIFRQGTRILKITRIAKILLAIVLLLTSGRIVITSPSSDIALCYFAIIFTVLLIKLISSETEVSIFFVFLLGGFLVFIKPFAGLLSLPLLVIMTLRHEFQAKLIFRSGFFAFIPYLVWLSYNASNTGNPFFPLFQDVFKGVGYGPEVMTNEEDVRRSYIQTIRYLTEIEFNIFNLELAQLQIVLSLFIALTATIISFKNIKGNSAVNSVYLSINITYLVLILYLGPLFRYLLFLNLIQILFFFEKQKVDLTPNKSKNNYPRGNVPNRIIPSILILISIYGLDKSKLEYLVRDETPPNSLVRQGISVNEPVFRSVINFIASRNNVKLRLAILGEGRASLFFPHSTLVFPNDRRNPFCNPGYISASEVSLNLKKLDLDFLLISSSWGWPKNMNINVLEDFRKLNRDSLVFQAEGWEVYELNK